MTVADCAVLSHSQPQPHGEKIKNLFIRAAREAVLIRFVIPRSGFCDEESR